MKLGYIRVSREKQTTALQEDAMRQEQCERTFTDKMTGKRFDRPEFLGILDLARTGDVIIVWRLDRLGRSLKTRSLLEVGIQGMARFIPVKLKQKRAHFIMKYALQKVGPEGFEPSTNQL